MAAREEKLFIDHSPPRRSVWSLQSTGEPAAGDADAVESLPAAIGDYRVFSHLGSGSMGDVFLAFDETLHRKVALKRIRPEHFRASDVRRRFEIEARVTSALQHPAIVPVYQFVREQDEVFYTMRPVEGISLAELLRRLSAGDPGARDNWPAARLVRLFLQAAGAVAYAHARGVIHRDLKPANIMIGPFEEVLVLDWGMAKILGSPEEDRAAPAAEPLPASATDSVPSSVVGTPAYMAPQQLMGEPATFASDVFSLGVTLYELLTLRLPWNADSLHALARAMETPPESPARYESARGIPRELARAVLRALEHDPRKRYPSVTAFAKEVADALEGRAPWRMEETALAKTNWSFTGGQLREEDGVLLLRSGGLLRYFCVKRFGDNVRVEFEFSVGPGSHELSVWLHTPEARASPGGEGYNLMVLASSSRQLSLLRSGRTVAGGPSPRCEPRRWYSVSATGEDDRFSLAIDGEEVYVYHDPIPMGAGHVGLSARTGGLWLRNLKIHSRGTSTTVSCLAVPDAFFNRRLYEEARDEYGVIAQSQPGRDEGRLAGFRAGLCLLAMVHREEDQELRALLLDDAAGVFSRLSGASDSCLAAVGHAMVAAERRDPAGEHDALARALTQYAGDPHLAAASEWLLGRLHAVGRGDRRTLAELLPLAISHCMSGWGGSLIRDLMRRVHDEWEVPSFMTSRGRFRGGDPASHAESMLVFGFWTARPDLIEQAVRALLAGERLRPHHLADAVFSLLELGKPHRARELLDRLDLPRETASDPRCERVLLLARSAILAALGNPQEGERIFARVVPDPSDRIYNSARLAQARAYFELGMPSRTFKLLRPLGGQERFSREHKAWFHLRCGDLQGASRQLRPLLERNDHRRGKNLSNFLYGTLLIRGGREEEAREVFSCLPRTAWPRTWTIGSHYALGRLGGGRLETYLAEAFPYERKCLLSHAELLAEARGQTRDALPRVLLS